MISNVRILITLMFIIAVSTTAQADSERDKNIKALNNLQHEMTTCVAFYAISRECMFKKDDPDTDKIDKITKTLSSHFVEIGVGIGLSQDAITSRLHMEMDKMTELLNKNCMNISSLLDRYALRCKKITENPDSILHEYLQK